MFKASTLSDQVYEYLLRQISSGEIPPGSPLRELDLVSQLNVSRTPIREALARLAEYGLVEIKPSRSTQVRSLRAAEVIQVYQVRQALEGLAVRLACGQLTPADLAHLEALSAACHDDGSAEYDSACYQLDLELHRLIALRSGNPILVREIRKLHDLVQLAHQPVADRKDRLALEVSQHREILARLSAGDARGSRRAMKTHLRTACGFLVRYLRQQERSDGAAAAEAAPRTADKR